MIMGGNLDSKIDAGLLLTEIEAGLTSARIALDGADDSAKVQTNWQHAQHAYETIIRSIPLAEMDTEAKEMIEEDLTRLESALAELSRWTEE